MAAEEDISQRVRRILGEEADDPFKVSILTGLIRDENYDDDTAKTMFNLYRCVFDETDEHMMTFIKIAAEITKYEGFNPQQMIKILIKKHAITEAVLKKNSKYVIYEEINIYEDQHMRISNNMSFLEDMTFLCFAFLTRGIKFRNQKMFAVMKRQMVLMNVKYDINTAKRRPGHTLDNKTVTISRIASTFSGITVELFHRGVGRSIVDSKILFPNHNLPRALFSPMIASAIPVHPDAPRAIVMAIDVAIDDILHQNAKRGLQNLYSYFLASYNSKAMLQKTRIRFCRDWNIVTYPNEDTDAFRFTDNVKAARERAKALISASRPNDPYLQTLMALI